MAMTSTIQTGAMRETPKPTTLTPHQLAIQYLSYHSGSMERADAEREAAISLMIHLIPANIPDCAWESLMHAMYYLRTGKYPVGRTPSKYDPEVEVTR